MGKLPAILLYDGDWYKDGVAGCSLAAQGLWLRMIFIGHNSDRYGYLSVNGSPIPPESIARRCGCTPDEYETLLAELDINGVPSRTPEGIIFSRRLVKDAAQRAGGAERQRRKRSKSSNGNITHDVTPLSVNEDVNVIPEVHVRFELSEFDGQAAFLDLCSVHPRAERDHLAQLALMERVQADAKELKISESDAYLKIRDAAIEYNRLQVAGKLEFIYPLGSWLRKTVYRQKPEVWCSGSKGRPRIVTKPLYVHERQKLKDMGVDMSLPMEELRRILVESDRAN